MGQQYVNNDRLELSYGNRAFPHFAPGDKDPHGQGFVSSNLIHGLNPIEFFSHAMGGREGLVDTASKTARVGYLNRQLMRAMEDIKIAADRTLRDGRFIVGFHYGGNGMDTSYIESQQYPCADVTVTSIRRAYQWRYIDSTDADVNADDVFASNSSSTADLDPVLAKAAAKEVKRITDDIITMRLIKLKYDTRKIDNEVKAPVAFARILKMAEETSRSQAADASSDEDGWAGGREGSHAALYVMRATRQLIKYCRAQVQCKAALLVFEALARINLCAKNVLVRHRLSRRAFDGVIIEVKKRFHLALVQAGEMVGCLSGQSIGEPCLQMTLNTFHLAGSGGKNMTAGISKMDELIRISKDRRKLRFALMDIFLLPEYQTKERAREMIKQIKPLLLSKFVIEEQCQMLWDPLPLQTRVAADVELVELHSFMMEEKECAHLSPLILRIVLNKAKCLEYGKTIDHIFWKLKELLPKSHSWMRSDVNAKDWVIRLRLNTKSPEFHQYEKKKKTNKRSIVSATKSVDSNAGAPTSDANPANGVVNAPIQELETVWQVRRMLLSSLVHGIPGISTCSIQKQKRVRFDDATLERVNKEETELYIETKGSNLRAVLLLKGVDTTRTISSNPREIEEVLGIEAATTAIMNEVRKLFAANNAYVDFAHFHVLAHAISRTGTLVGFGKNGYHQNSKLGFLKRISFERVIKTIIEAASAGGVDTGENMTSNVQWGNAPPIGTNSGFTIFNYPKIYAQHRKVIEANERICRARMSSPLTKTDLLRLLPTLATNPNFMRQLGGSQENEGETYHYQNYKRKLAEKQHTYYTPDYDYLLDPSLSVSTVAQSARRAQDRLRQEHEEEEHITKLILTGRTHLSLGNQPLRPLPVYTPYSKTAEIHSLLPSASSLASSAPEWLTKSLDRVLEREAKILLQPSMLSFYAHPSFVPYPLVPYARSDNECYGAQKRKAGATDIGVNAKGKKKKTTTTKTANADGANAGTNTEGKLAISGRKKKSENSSISAVTSRLSIHGAIDLAKS